MDSDGNVGTAPHSVAARPGSARPRVLLPGKVGSKLKSWDRRSVVLLLALVAFGCWYATLGASLRDDAHAVALAWRIARGDVPFQDEMNLQVLGALPAVAFVWVWLQLVGVTGLVLASRIFFVAFAAVIGVFAVRALRTRLGWGPACAAVITASLALPYNIAEVSYNTVALLMLVLASAAGFAAVQTLSRGWAAIAGVSVTVGMIILPQTAPGALVLLALVTAFTRRRQLLLALLGGVLVPATGFVLWVALHPGIQALVDTLNYTSEYQAQRGAPEQRLLRTVTTFGDQISEPVYWPMWLLTLVASIPRSRAVARVALGLVPLAAAAPAWSHLFTAPGYVTFGDPAGMYGLILLTALTPPATSWAVANPRHPLTALLLLTAPVSLLAVPVLAATTSSGPLWGAPAVGAVPLLMALVAIWATRVSTHGAATLALLPALLMVVALALRPFPGAVPWQLTERLSEGAFWGLRATPGNAEMIRATTRASSQLLHPNEPVLFYGTRPGGYLVADEPPATNILWIDNFGEAGRVTLEYLCRTGRDPEVVFVEEGSATRAKGWKGLEKADPLMAYVAENYRLVADDVGGVYRVYERATNQQGSSCDAIGE